MEVDRLKNRTPVTGIAAPTTRPFLWQIRLVHSLGELQMSTNGGGVSFHSLENVFSVTERS